MLLLESRQLASWGQRLSALPCICATKGGVEPQDLSRQVQSSTFDPFPCRILRTCRRNQVSSPRQRPAPSMSHRGSRDDDAAVQNESSARMPNLLAGLVARLSPYFFPFFSRQGSIFSRQLSVRPTKCPSVRRRKHVQVVWRN